MDTHICLQWHPNTSDLIMEADRTQINRLFTNLIKNASEAIEDEEACIDITEQLENGSVTIAITDNGPGIPEELKDSLFRPNFTTKSSGTGLGLAICKDIAERANGTIWFESGNGKPTTFFVRLPVIEA
jgi:signal transduction histidine kinase